MQVTFSRTWLTAIFYSSAISWFCRAPDLENLWLDSLVKSLPTLMLLLAGSHFMAKKRKWELKVNLWLLIAIVVVLFLLVIYLDSIAKTPEVTTLLVAF